MFACENITRSAHVGRELKRFVEALIDDPVAQVLVAKVTDHEIVGFGFAEFRELEIDAADPIALALQSAHKVIADETARTADQSSFPHDLFS
jgi:hypothetical protein